MTDSKIKIKLRTRTREIISFNRHRSLSINEQLKETLSQSQKEEKKTKQIHHHFEMVLRESFSYELITILITTLYFRALSLNEFNQLYVNNCLKPNKQTIGAKKLDRETTATNLQSQKTVFLFNRKKKIFKKMLGVIINRRFTVLMKKNAASSLSLNLLLLICCRLFLNSAKSDHFEFCFQCECVSVFMVLTL